MICKFLKYLKQIENFFTKVLYHKCLNTFVEKRKVKRIKESIGERCDPLDYGSPL